MAEERTSLSPTSASKETRIITTSRKTLRKSTLLSPHFSPLSVRSLTLLQLSSICLVHFLTRCSILCAASDSSVPGRTSETFSPFSSETGRGRTLIETGTGTKRQNWVSDAETFLANSGDVRRNKRRRRRLPNMEDLVEGPRKVVDLFPCRWKPLSVPLPYQWFCHESGSGISIEGPDGPMETTRLGQVLGEGPHIYSFKPKTNGHARILHEGREVDTFQAQMDSCNCPLPHKDFIREYTCGQADVVRLNKLFSHWLRRSVTRKIMDDFWERPPFGTVSHISIINNEVYYRHVKNETWAWSWPTFVELLSSLVRKVQLPDVEFYAHNADWPQSGHLRVGPPVFSFTTDSLHSDIPIPCKDHIMESFRGITLRDICFAKPWDDRDDEAYFRGDNTGDEDMRHKDYIPFHPRFRAAMLSNQRPDLLDVKVYIGHGWKIDPAAKDWADKMNLTAPTKSDPKSRPWDFKYTLDLDGFSAPFRTSYLLAGGSLVLKQISPYELYFYEELRHGVNTLEIDFNLRDLVKTMEWAQKHERVSRRIAEEGFKFYWSRLRQEDILCWMAQALRRVAKAQKFKPKIAPGMVKMTTSSSNSCDC